jgi:hypothetical protein
MRAVAILLALLLALCIAWAGYLAATAVVRRREGRLHQNARWRMTHHGEDGATVVTVSLVRPDGWVLDRHEVARVPDGAPDWDTRFLAAQQVAEERAFHLNATGTHLPP